MTIDSGFYAGANKCGKNTCYDREGQMNVRFLLLLPCLLRLFQLSKVPCSWSITRWLHILCREALRTYHNTLFPLLKFLFCSLHKAKSLPLGVKRFILFIFGYCYKWAGNPPALAIASLNAAQLFPHVQPTVHSRVHHLTKRLKSPRTWKQKVLYTRLSSSHQYQVLHSENNIIRSFEHWG